MENVRKIGNVGAKAGEVINALAPQVKLYQETRDQRVFTDIYEVCEAYIQSYAFTKVAKYGLQVEDCKATLDDQFVKIVDNYDPERGLTFYHYLNYSFKMTMKSYFRDQSEKEHFFGSYSKGDQYGEEREKYKSYMMVYIDAGVQTDGDMLSGFDMYDPRADIETLICEDDDVRRLTAAIEKEEPEACVVATLRATGREKREIARLLGHFLDGSKQLTAQNNWVDRRLKKCIKPVTKYYASMGVPIPIQLRA